MISGKIPPPMTADGHFAKQNALPTTPTGATPGRSASVVGFFLGG